MDLLIKILEWLERWMSRVFAPVLRGLILFAAWATRRGRYRRWRREQGEPSAGDERHGGTGWE